MVFSAANCIFYLAVLLGTLPTLLLLASDKAKTISLKPIKPYLWLVCLGDLQELAGKIYSFFGTGYETKYGFFIYTILEFFVLSFYFAKILDKKYSIVCHSFLVVYLAALFYIGFFWDIGRFSFNMSGLSVVLAIMAATCCVLWLREMIRANLPYPLSKLPDFLFVSALLIYYSGTALVFAFDDLINKSGHAGLIYATIVVSLCIVMRILLSVGVIRAKSFNPATA